MSGRNIHAVGIRPLARTWILAAALVACMMAMAGSSYASTTVTLPPLGPATGHSCSSTEVYAGLPLPELPPSLRGVPVPGWTNDNLYSNGQTPLGDNCGDVSTGSKARGVAATASTTFDDAGQLAMSNTATPSASPEEAALTSGSQQQKGTIVPPLTSQTETLSVTYTYEVLAEAHQNGGPADVGTGTGLHGGPGPGNTARCEGQNFPQVTLTGTTEYESHPAIGMHTVTVQYTCPAGHPLQTSYVEFGISEGHSLNTFTTTQSSYVATRWDGGTLTVGP